MAETPLKRGAASRARIVEAALDMLANEGLDRFSLRELAKRATMKLGNLQYYFPTREDLLEAVISAEFARNRDALRELERTAPDLSAYMRGLPRILIEEYTGAGGKVWPVLNVLQLHKRRFRELSKAIYQEHYTLIASALRRFGVPGTRAQRVRKARLVTALVDGAALQAHTGPHAAASASWRALCRKVGELALAIARE